MNIADFLSRLPADSVHRNTVEIAGGTVDAFRKKVQEIKSNRNYSVEGHRNQIKTAAENPLKFYAELKKQAASDRAKLDARREDFRLRPLSRDDVVGALDRQEIRAWLRSVPAGERQRHALTDPTIAAAVASAPAALSGLDAEIHTRVINAELERQFGPELTILNGESQNLDVVDAVLAVAERQLLVEAGMIDTKPNNNGGNTNVQEAA
jgi:hypothetical protein